MTQVIGVLRRSELASAGQPGCGTRPICSTGVNTLLREHGFTVRHDDDLVSLATTLRMPIRRRGSLENSRIAIADHA